MTIDQKRAYKAYNNIFFMGLLATMVFGGWAYHFIFGTGFFAGIELDTAFWGAIFAGLTSFSVFYVIYSFVKGIALDDES